MQKLTFEFCFKRVVEGWSGMARLAIALVAFEHHFSQPLERARWPASLQCLKFGHEFNQSRGKMDCPASRQKLSLDYECKVHFYQHYLFQPIAPVAQF